MKVTQLKDRALHDQRVQEVIEEYRNRGYHVIIEPTKADLPEFLNAFRPDILAKGPNEAVIIEVKLEGKKPNADWAGLAREIKQHSGWRLELLIGAQPADAVPADAPVLSLQDIEERFKTGYELLERGDNAIALLTAWTATEAALRQALQHQDEDNTSSPGHLISALYSDGPLEKEEYDVLMTAMRQRNQVVHGFQIEKVKKATLDALHKITARLTSANMAKAA